MMNKSLQHILTILLLLMAAGATAFAQGGASPEPAAEKAKRPRVMILGNVYGGGELAQVIASDAASAQAQLIQDADLATLFTTHADHVYTTQVHLGDSSEVYGRVFGGGKGQENTLGESAGRVTGQTDVALDGATVWSEIYGGGEMADVRGNTLLHFKKGKAGHNAFGGGLGKLTEKTADDAILPDNRQEVLASADVKLIPADYSLITDDSKEHSTTPTLKSYYHADGTIKDANHWMTEKKTGESFVVFDGIEQDNGDGTQTSTYTHYEFKTSRTVNRDNDGDGEADFDTDGQPVKDGVPVKVDGLYYSEREQFDAGRPDQLFSINHNIYGGGMTASQVESKTFVHINYGMVNEEMMDYEHEGEKVWSTVYNSIANAQFCVFGGGYGYYTDILGDTHVTMDIKGIDPNNDLDHYEAEVKDEFYGFPLAHPKEVDHHYLDEFKRSFETAWAELHNNPAPDIIDQALKQALWTNGAPGHSCMDIVGGGYNGKVHGSTYVSVRGDVVLRKVYGGGYYASVGDTHVDIASGLYNRIYGGGLIGNVYGKAEVNFGLKGTGDLIKENNRYLFVKDAIYGGNDVSGTVGTMVSGQGENNGVTFNYYDPVDDDEHGVRLNLNGGIVYGDVYGAGNGNHPGYGNPAYVEFSLSQHPSENYRTLPHAVTLEGVEKNQVYKYRPRTGRMVMNIAGNEGSKGEQDEDSIDKVRIWGRTFGGGNSCNVGAWDGTADDHTEVYGEGADSWHPGDNFVGGGTIQINIGSHVQLGNRNDNHVAPNGLFMGSNGEHMITQHTDIEKAKYYHQYYDPDTQRYWPGFPVYQEGSSEFISREAGLKSFKAFINTITTKSDNVFLNINDDAQDIWMSNFVGGGYRGSMQAATANGKFNYRLPKGVTIGHAAVGGAFNAHIIYRIYATTDGHEYAEYVDSEGHKSYRYEHDAAKAGTEGIDYLRQISELGPDGTTQESHFLRYNYDGGMLAHDSQMNSNSSGSRCHAVKNAGTASDFITPDQGYNAHKDKALVTLDLRNRLDPVILNDGAQVHGGIVYGGCFSSGFVEGDVWVDYRCSLLPTAQDVADSNEKGKYYDKTNPNTYAHADEMETHRALLVFGAGYGEDTTVDGDVYLRLLHNGRSEDLRDYPLIYNAFGGGNMGKVSGNTNVYYNVGNRGTLLGSVYGGGYQGAIGGNTYLEMAGGLAINAYGGSREANIGGAAHVWVYDGQKFPAGEDNDEAKRDGAPLLIGNLYGGNDISGTISGGARASYASSQWSDIEDTDFNTYIQVASTKADGSRGFPLIGNLFAGGNGANTPDGTPAPDVQKSLLHIAGGNILRAFGGGNRATITEDASILVKAQTDVFTSHEFESVQKYIIQQLVFKGIYAGYHWEGNTLHIDPFHAVNLFGGNNLAEMRIQPKWNLLDGSLGNVYSGGNMGDMTYYNALGGSAGHEDEPKGLSLTINSDDIRIHSLFGGCRMSDVRATLYAQDGEGNETATPQTFADNEYGATVNVKKGRIENVYGGNDISGFVYGGSVVNLSGSVTGSVYAGGNGNYLYACDRTPQQDYVGAGRIAETWNDDIQQVVYYIPGNASDTPLQQLLAINNARPNVEKSSLNIAGASESQKVYISGAVYCGGNAATVRPMQGNDATVRFSIGDNAIVNAVFMGSNGESLKYDESNAANSYIEHFELVNGFNLAQDLTASDWDVLNDANTNMGDKELLTTSPNPATMPVLGAELRAQLYPNLLSVYMRAVDVKALPEGFTSFSDHDFHNTWLGTFCMGGNAGSMMMDQPVDIVFPQSLNLFGRIIGGCRDAAFQYKGKWHRGGFRMPLAQGAELDGVPTKTKLRMKIRGDWYSRRMIVDEADSYKMPIPEVAPVGDYLVIDKTDDGTNWKVDGKAWNDGCNVYGGCYESGDMVGDVVIYIESDMLAYSRYIDSHNIDTYQNAELDESNRLHIPVANVYGAGYGAESRNFGDAYIYMKDIPSIEGSVHPSVNNLFGGGRNGMLVGNSVIHVHDGLVFKDVVGGSYAAPLYGSSQVTVGYPKFYVCKQSGEYVLDRGDKWNVGHKTKGNNREDDVIKQRIKYFEGTYVPCNVYDQITKVKLHGSSSETDLSDIHPATRTSNDYFEFHDESTDASLFPQGGWDNVEIRVRGGVYGGGFSLNNSTSAVAGSYTTLANTTTYNHGADSRGNSSVGYGGNSSVIIADFVGTPAGGQTVKNHIKISTEQSGGIFGDGRLVFCEGFRTAELNGYGYATGVPNGTGDAAPLELNTLQRFDLLTLNDCCMQLDGDQDFATDQLDSREYSMARIGELRMNSSIDANSNLDSKRNYVGFNNNVHFLGAIVTNDDFSTAPYHTFEGKKSDVQTYLSFKTFYIDWYDESGPELFKQRNTGTARNMVGLNSGYYLRIENQYYDGEEKKTYYGPIVGVCEAKLNNIQPGEGGGYIYADNIHDAFDSTDPIYQTPIPHNAGEHFLQTSGNFVFPGIVPQGSTEKQYIVDDCFMNHFGTPDAPTTKQGELDEAHYWYVEGDTYYYNTTLTALSYNASKTFDLITNDPNVIFSGIEDGSTVTLESVQWQTPTPAYPTGYTSDIRGGNESQLEALPGSTDTYKFTLEVGDGYTWSQLMPRSTADNAETIDPANKPSSTYTASGEHALPSSPQFNVRLFDNVDNNPKGNEEAYYNAHLQSPEKVKIVVKARKDGQSEKTFIVTLDINYVQGPSFTGHVQLHNCALPGERIEFSSDGVEVKTTDLLPITSFDWKLVPLTREQTSSETGKTEYEWRADDPRAVAIPATDYAIDLAGAVAGSVPALYSQNHWNVFYTFVAGGETFTVQPTKEESAELHEQMLLVHNYHRMKDITPENFDTHLTNGEGEIFDKVLKAGACVYLEDEDDLAAFIAYVNQGNTGEGINFILQHDITTTRPLATLDHPFAGTFHGDGHHIQLAAGGSSLFGNQLTGKVYNLGVVQGTISQVDTQDANGIVRGTHTINSFEHATTDAMTYGANAYDLSHHFTPTNDATLHANYVHLRYANGDYQYATTDRPWSLRSGTPHYGSTLTHHNTQHPHDAARWSEAKQVNLPLHDGKMVLSDSYRNGTTFRGLPLGYANDYLFFGQHLDRTHADPFPTAIAAVASGDTEPDKGGNRVYKTSGFYQTTDDEGFFYNKDAWALHPRLTAIDFTAHWSASDAIGYTQEPDHATTTPLTFHVDSNADHCSGDYDNRSFGHVTQNLLVYRENNAALEPDYTGTSDAYEAIFAEGIYANHTPESAIRYHLLRNVLQQGASGDDARSSSFFTDYFHLVDCQDYHAPQDFFVNERAWYERLPQCFRTIEGNYATASAWEGLCLPFPFVTKVSGEQPGNELSHFFGVPTAEMLSQPALNDRTLHHEYWLAGLAAAQGSTVDFARPSLEGGDALFTSEKQFSSQDYTLNNSYFKALPHYLSHYSTRDDANWYATPHTFTPYPHITVGIPYLVAFPGADFYEFDLTDQKLTFEFVSPRLLGNPTYPIFAEGSDNIYAAFIGQPDRTTTVGSTAHVGTFVRVEADDQHIGINEEGSAFDNTSDPILPFRTYLTTGTSSNAPAFRIFDGSNAQSFGAEPEEPEEDGIHPGLHIWAEGRTIVVDTPEACNLPLYGTDGAQLNTLTCRPGINRFAQPRPGIFVVKNKKLLLK